MAILTPLAVARNHRNLGIGQMLMDAAHLALEAAGERTFVVLGHPSFYPGAGYSSQAASDIVNPWNARKAFMLRGDGVGPSTLIVSPAMTAD